MSEMREEGYAVSGADKTFREDGAIVRIYETIDWLSRTVSTLGERLDPALRPEESMVAESPVKIAAPESELRRLDMKLHNQVVRLEAIIGRIDL